MYVYMVLSCQFVQRFLNLSYIYNLNCHGRLNLPVYMTGLVPKYVNAHDSLWVTCRRDGAGPDGRQRYALGPPGLKGQR